MPAINEALFDETTHSPSLIDLVGYEQAAKIVDFCFIANPHYPTQAMVDELVRRLPELIRSYPSSNPMVSARHLAAVLKVDASHLIVGNGATELITELCHRLVPTIGVPVPTFGEYIEKIDTDRLRLYPLDAHSRYQLDLGAYRAWLRKEELRAALIINPHNPTGQLFTLDEMHAFLDQVRDLDLVIVDESFIDFAGEQVPSLLHSAESYANSVNTGSTAREVQRRLLVDHGLYVRDCSNKVGMDRYHIRVASQGRAADACLVEALPLVLARS
jgi:threonine-phosphate decarboxylase